MKFSKLNLLNNCRNWMRFMISLEIKKTLQSIYSHSISKKPQNPLVRGNHKNTASRGLKAFVSQKENKPIPTECRLLFRYRDSTPPLFAEVFLQRDNA